MKPVRLCFHGNAAFVLWWVGGNILGTVRTSVCISVTTSHLILTKSEGGAGRFLLKETSGASAEQWDGGALGQTCSGLFWDHLAYAAATALAAVGVC